MMIPINTRKIYAGMVKKCWSEEETARAAKITRQGLWAIIKRGTCTISVVGRLAKALELDPETIIQ